MSRRTGAANGATAARKEVSEALSEGSQEKQKMLLASDTGHFSLIKALHLADLITELNGTTDPILLFPLAIHPRPLHPSSQTTN
ncbi:CDP-diacylglycerol-serine O-phosphatidyltransferase [Schaereria dolodes]|nr:CDP-diacylglycerol-serine O-phosphatidyltransferase [Schaereria dolodes]